MNEKSECRPFAHSRAYAYFGPFKNQPVHDAVYTATGTTASQLTIGAMSRASVATKGFSTPIARLAPTVHMKASKPNDGSKYAPSHFVALAAPMLTPHASSHHRMPTCGPCLPYVVVSRRSASLART